MANVIEEQIDCLKANLAQEIDGLKKFLANEAERKDVESEARAIVFSAKGLFDIMAQIEILRKTQTRIDRMIGGQK